MKSKKKIKDYFYIQRELKKALGQDLVYSLAIDNDTYVLAISVHKSKEQKFNHNRLIQTCYLSEQDFNEDVDDLIAKIIELYKPLLMARSKMDEFIDHEAL